MRRRALVSFVVAAALALIAALPAAAEGGSASREERGGTLLALGDSVAFGYSPLLDHHVAANFVGYPEVVAQRLDLADVNASCPGEATGGFLSLTGTDNGCRVYRFGFLYPLHVSYSGTQMDFAIDYLRAHRNVRLVTIDIGANDVFVLRRTCSATANPAACVAAGLPGVLATIGANLRTIFSTIREDGRYRGPLVTLSYYSLAYDPVTAARAQQLNQPIIAATQAFRGVVASGFDAFRPAALAAGGSSCTAGLLIVLPSPPAPPGMCDVHPTPKGRDLLANAIVEAVEDQDRDLAM
jgi:lysophospholipase L1-like esterase